ncbi:Pre-rRNA-processing protein TSR2-domain-containing protein [Dichotomocladium elegans]|nr:Pre-rRNA-processing protein TSR2-domain-containing protein [Dichotomocladium elegans]
MAEHPNKVAFQEGANYIFKSWTALNLAVEQDWGGVDSAEKRDWMIDVVVDYFDKHGKKLDVDDIEDILSQIMVDEFQTILEDDSAHLVAKHLVELYHQCVRGNFAEVERLRQKQASRSNVVSRSQAQVNDDDEVSNDDGDDEDNDDHQGNSGADSMDVDGPPARPEPEIDEDGFQTVSYRKRR